MPTFLSRSLAVAVVLAATACAGDDTPASEVPAVATELTEADKANSLLFVARAPTGTLEVAGDEAVLTLDDVATVTWFTDRPAHDAGTTTPDDAFDALGWDGDGTALGSDAPNAALVAAELGDDTVVVELLTATIHDTRISFDVSFVGGDPALVGDLTAVELFIDDAVPSYAAGIARPQLTRTSDGRIILGQSMDGSALTLGLASGDADALDALVGNDQLFAVVSGSAFTTTGSVDVPAVHPPTDDTTWSFSVDGAHTGDEAPIVIIKNTSGSVTDRAASPTSWAMPGDLNDDVPGTSTRLQAVIADIADRAVDDSAYRDLHANLVSPSWNGIVIFNAAAVVPDQVQATPSGDLAGTTVLVVAVGFTAWPPGPAGPISEDTGPLFGVVDHPQPAAGQDPRPTPWVRATFDSWAMTSAEVDPG